MMFSLTLLLALSIIGAKTEERQDFSDDELGLVFQGTLTFLYRLLFLLYAEARDLLPVQEQRDSCRIPSLQRMKESIAQRAGPIFGGGWRKTG